MFHLCFYGGYYNLNTMTNNNNISQISFSLKNIHFGGDLPRATQPGKLLSRIGDHLASPPGSRGPKTPRRQGETVIVKDNYNRERQFLLKFLEYIGSS